MTESSRSVAQHSAEDDKRRRMYSRPLLTRYGPVKDITASGSNPLPESTMGMGVSRRD